jgi:Protein of unknown function (DUF901).
MNNEYWLDGFNFFHHWERTRGAFRDKGVMDIAKTLERSLRVLSRELGGRRGMTMVFLDGGLARLDTRQSGVRVRYSGPGKKADDRMADDLSLLGPDGKKVTAVSNDRELRARLRLHGATCLTVSEFLALFEQKNSYGKQARTRKSGAPQNTDAETLREKHRTLSPAEVDAWLEFFGGEPENR